MKISVLKTLIIFLFAATGCQREANVQEVMDTEAQRKEVYATIMDNPAMRQEMMQTMRQHPEGGMMIGEGMMGRGQMMGDSAGMQGMGRMNRENMHDMMQQMMTACEQDSANCQMMSQMMLNNQQMMQNMMQHMQQKGMMDEACYQKMINNLKAGMKQ